MLARTASQLYWLGRYFERMDYVARLLDTASRMAVMPAPSKTNEWNSALIAAGAEPAFLKKHEKITAQGVVDYLGFDRDNSSSIMSALSAGRANARAVRSAVTADMWEVINNAYLEAKSIDAESFGEESLSTTLDWVKRQAMLFNAAVDHTMLHALAFHFVCLGRYLERADNTARILDVKYHLLLPSYEQVGGSVDYHQWSAILRAVSARRAYHAIYKDRVRPWNLAELLITRAELPRSLCACYRNVTEILDHLAATHGAHGECHRLAGATFAKLRYGQIDVILKGGLHEFLTDMVNTTARLSDEVHSHYLHG